MAKIKFTNNKSTKKVTIKKSTNKIAIKKPSNKSAIKKKKNTRSDGKVAKICAIIFTIIGMFVGIRFIYPTLVGIYTLTTISNAKKKKDLYICGWVTTIFCNLIAGICIACMKFPEEDKSLIAETNKLEIKPKTNFNGDLVNSHANFASTLKRNEMKNILHDILLSYGLDKVKRDEIYNNIFTDSKFENYTNEQIYNYIIESIPNKEPDMDTFMMVYNSLLDKLCEDESLKIDMSVTFSPKISPQLCYEMGEEIKNMYHEDLTNLQNKNKDVTEYRFNYTAFALGVMYGIAQKKRLYPSAEVLKKNICDYAACLGYKFNF